MDEGKTSLSTVCYYSSLLNNILSKVSTVTDIRM